MRDTSSGREDDGRLTSRRHEGRLDYGAIGTVTNLAARLCGEASATEILVSQRVAGGVENLVSMETLGPLTLKGFARPVPAFRVLGPRTP